MSLARVRTLSRSLLHLLHPDKFGTSSSKVKATNAAAISSINTIITTLKKTAGASSPLSSTRHPLAFYIDPSQCILREAILTFPISQDLLPHAESEFTRLLNIAEHGTPCTVINKTHKPLRTAGTSRHAPQAPGAAFARESGAPHGHAMPPRPPTFTGESATNTRTHTHKRTYVHTHTL